MKSSYLRDQRGVAMLLELVLVAAVLALVGLAVYQSGQQGKTASSPSKATPQTTEGLATTTAALVEQDSATDTALAASAESSANELSQTDADITNLGSASNATF